ncbi:MAG: ATP-dependent Clp protease proteolytic subunit [Patescibacteria group bacterium]
MLTHDKEFSQRNNLFLRQLFFEKRRLIFLEDHVDGSGGAAYCNDPTMPGWSVSPRGVIDQILYLDHVENSQNSPIRLVIDSPGGYVSYYLNLYDVIQAARSPIYTIAMGFIASAAAPILAGGFPGKRYIFASSRTMIHLPRGGAHGDDEDLDKQAKQLRKIKDTYMKILGRHTGKDPDEIEKAINRKDHFMDAMETIEFGLADNLVTSLEETFVL